MMPKMNTLPAFNAITLVDNGIVLDSLAEAMSDLHSGSTVARFNEIEKVIKQLEVYPYRFLIIDLRVSGPGIKQFIAFCKRKYRDLLIIIMGSAEDIALMRDFFNIGIHAYVSPDITAYEFKVTLAKTFSGEKYVGTSISGKLASHFLTSHHYN